VASCRLNPKEVDVRVILVIALALGVAACESASEEHQAREDAECRSMGLSPGAPAYVDCRMRLAEAREARLRAFLQANPLQNPSSGYTPVPAPKTTRCTNDGYGNITCRESSF
jgi:hypothetical protein